VIDALLLFWLIVRGWFFLAPTSLEASGEGSLGAAWRASHGHVMTISLVFVPLLILMLLLLGGGESLMHRAGIFSPVARWRCRARALRRATRASPTAA